MAEEKKEEKKEEKSCCCSSADGKCCKHKKFFPHNWFKLKCLTHIFYVFFYLGIVASIYMLVQLGLFFKYAKMGMIGYDSLPQMIALVLFVIVSTFLMLAVAKICKALRKIKRLLKEQKEENKK
ncbi:MAG: hypothetical protein FWF35_05505 [Elusimicrobia bacterium]|nr:hypothetical protein [Elusimicrobiota bacterium]